MEYTYSIKPFKEICIFLPMWSSVMVGLHSVKTNFSTMRAKSFGVYWPK